MTFREHLAWLKKQHQMLVIDDPVDPELEAAEIIRQVNQHSPCPVLFNNLHGHQYSVVANLFYCQDAIDAFYAAHSSMADVLSCAPATVPTRTPLSQWLASQPVYSVERRLHPFDAVAANTESLSSIPLLTYWPEDSGPYLSMAVTIVRDLEGRIHCGIYRLERHGDYRLTLHCLPGSRTRKICEEYQRVRRPMPIAVVAGVEPALMIAAMLPLEREIDTIAFAAWLQGQEIACSASPVHGLPVPVEWEMCLEGSVAVDETDTDGPHGNYRGSYGDAVACPVIHVEKIWAKHDAICPVTAVGPPPTESYTLARARLSYVKWVLTRSFPWISEMKWLDYGEYHNNLVVQVKTVPGLNQREALLAHPLVESAQLVVLVDSEVSIDRTEHLLWRCFNLPWDKAVSWCKNTLVIDMTYSYGKNELKSNPFVSKNVEQRLNGWLQGIRGDDQ